MASDTRDHRQTIEGGVKKKTKNKTLFFSEIVDVFSASYRISSTAVWKLAFLILIQDVLDLWQSSVLSSEVTGSSAVCWNLKA